MVIYQTFRSDDPANTDAFHETLKSAVALARENGIEGPIRLTDGSWSGEMPEGYEFYIERHNVNPTRAGICSALLYIPNR